MDIQVSSNFERLLFDLHHGDAAALKRDMEHFETSRRMTISRAARDLAAKDFTSARVDHAAMSETMRWAQSCGHIIDPHTAIGLAAARSTNLPVGVPIVTLATAHPAKFGDAVGAALGFEPVLPARIATLAEKEERCVSLAPTLDAVIDYIGAHATPRRTHC